MLIPIMIFITVAVVMRLVVLDRVRWVLRMIRVFGMRRTPWRNWHTWSRLAVWQGVVLFDYAPSPAVIYAVTLIISRIPVFRF